MVKVVVAVVDVVCWSFRRRTVQYVTAGSLIGQPEEWIFHNA